ncbi:MAG: hypothetical protein OJF52_000065 [Nitrospira sp.]|nr:MAG: hypothetical protein OJF52_000065 [Nitrospira sp.]
MLIEGFVFRTKYLRTSASTDLKCRTGRFLKRRLRSRRV